MSNDTTKRNIVFSTNTWNYLKNLRNQSRGKYLDDSVKMRMGYRYHVYSMFSKKTGRTYFGVVEDKLTDNIMTICQEHFVSERPELVMVTSMSEHLFESHAVFGAEEDAYVFKYYLMNTHLNHGGEEDAYVFKYYLMNTHLDHGGEVENVGISNGAIPRVLSVELPYNIAQAVVKICTRRNVYVSAFIGRIIRKYLKELKSRPSDDKPYLKAENI